MSIPEDVQAWLANTQGLIEVEEGERLAQLAAEVPANRAIVEIGTHTGLSTCWMAAGSRAGNGAHIIAVDPYPEPRPDSRDDPWELGPQGVIDRMLANIAGRTQWTSREDYGDLITPLRLTSLEAAKAWLMPIGLVFIDAQHGYGDVCDDANAWAPKVSPGGWVAFHDYYDDPERTHLSQVADAIRDTVEPMGCWISTEVTWNTWIARRA